MRRRAVALTMLVVRRVTGDALHEYRLEAMHRRAELFEMCVRSHPKLKKRKMMEYEVLICRPKKVAFVHVYKGGGTIVMDLLRRTCPEQTEELVNWRDRAKMIEKDIDTSVILDASELKDHLENFTTFTFVRDPLQRFQSGVFEVVARGGYRPKLDLAFATNRTLGSVIIDGVTPSSTVNPHIVPQTDMLLHEAGLLARIDYIGVVSPVGFTAELATIAQEFLHIDQDVIDDHLRSDHTRDSHYYTTAPLGPFGHIRHEHLEPDAIASIYSYYRIDYDCLGFAV